MNIDFDGTSKKVVLIEIVLQERSIEKKNKISKVQLKSSSESVQKFQKKTPDVETRTKVEQRSKNSNRKTAKLKTNVRRTNYKPHQLKN